MPRLTKEEKKEEVARLADKFKQAKAAIFTQYSGLTVKEMTKLRTELGEKGIEFKVVKTTLIKKALEKDNLPLPAENVLGKPIAVAFSPLDEITPTKILSAAGKLTDKVKMLAALVDGKLREMEYLVVLANLPDKNELIARLIGSLANPTRRLVLSLGQPVGLFNSVIKQYQFQKVSGEN